MPETTDSQPTESAAQPEQAPTAPPVVVLADAPIAAIPDVRRDELVAHVRAAEHALVDVEVSPDVWEVATVQHLDLDGGRVGVVFEGPMGFEPEAGIVAIEHVRPHRPCRCNDPEQLHALGDRRWCLAAPR